MKILMTTALLLSLAGVMPPQKATVSGKWTGNITATREDGSSSDNSALLLLEQKDSTITGTIGGDENDQHPITSGKIDGKKVVIDAKHAGNGREFHLELTLEGDEMKGAVTSGERKAQLSVKRQPDAKK